MSARNVTAGIRRSLLVALLFLASTTGIVLGQEASDTGEMSVSVLPSGELETRTEGTEADAPPPARPRQQDTGGRPGTVSAWVERLGNGVIDRTEPPTQLVVRDDRGTAAGWYVLLSTGSDGSEPWVPFLMGNDPGTIVRILPAGASPIALGELQVGWTLGPLAGPLRILEALPGNGAGLFMQTLSVIYPAVMDDGVQVIFVHIVSGP